MHPRIVSDPDLTQLGTSVLDAVRVQFPPAIADGLAFVWVICNRGSHCRSFSYRGDVLAYPASVVKLFYLVAVEAWIAAGRLSAVDSELQRACNDAIATSSNDATSLLVDYLSGTTSGPMLPPEEFARWQQQRHAVNRYFQAWGCKEFAGINVSQKTWGDDYYGRERAFVGLHSEHRNALSPLAVARLLLAIVRGDAISPERSQAMLDLLARSPQTPLEPGVEENQVAGFLGAGLPKGAHLHSKAGWTSWVRNDAAYIELPGSVPPYILVAFSQRVRGTPAPRELLPFLSAQIAETWLKSAADFPPIR